MVDIIATVALNSSFATLVDDRSLALKPNASSREREAICDITFDGVGTYPTGGVTVDFSTIRKFSRVYSCEVLHHSIGVIATYVPATADDAATGKLKLFGMNAHNHTLKVVGGGVIVTDGNLGVDATGQLVKVAAGNLDITSDADSGLQANAVTLFDELPNVSALPQNATFRVRIRGI